MTTVDLSEVLAKNIGPVKAIILNHGDHAYLKVRFDNNTLQNF